MNDHNCITILILGKFWGQAICAWNDYSGHKRCLVNVLLELLLTKYKSNRLTSECHIWGALNLPMWAYESILKAVLCVLLLGLIWLLIGDAIEQTHASSVVKVESVSGLS